MKRKIQNIFSSVSTKVLMIMVALVLPLNVIAIIYTNMALKTIVEQVEFNVQKVLDYQMYELRSRMKISHSFLAYFAIKDVDYIRLKDRQVTGDSFDMAKMKVYSKMKNMAEMTDGGDGYFYYFLDRKDGIIYGNADKNSGITTQLRVFLENFELDEERRGWHIYEWDDKKYLLLMLQETHTLYGSVIFLDPYLLNLNNEIEYPISQFSITEKQPEEKREAMISVRSGTKDVFLNVDLKQEDILKSVSYSQQIFWRIAVLYLILVPILYLVLRKLLIHPLLLINQAHRQLEHGNGSYRIQEISSSTEYRVLYNSFNKMVANLNRLKIEGYEKEIARQKMELNNLQLQIRPHFLLNTFNIIFSLAQRKEVEMIQETVIYLSDYFRYMFRNEKELELFPKELKLIHGYVRTASIRYSGRVEAEYDIEPELDFVRVPPLLIHNFIENAVKHGIKKKDILHIRLQGHYDNRMVTFQIEDNGKGMSPAALERSQQMLAGEFEPENKEAHLGLYNSLRRLKYFYGNEAFIEVMSQLGEGTVFAVHFPYDVEVWDEYV